MNNVEIYLIRIGNRQRKRKKTPVMKKAYRKLTPTTKEDVFTYPLSLKVILKDSI